VSGSRLFTLQSYSYLWGSKEFYLDFSATQCSVLQQQDGLCIRNRIEPCFISLTLNPTCPDTIEAGRCERLNFEPEVTVF